MHQFRNVVLPYTRQGFGQEGKRSLPSGSTYSASAPLITSRMK